MYGSFVRWLDEEKCVQYLYSLVHNIIYWVLFWFYFGCQGKQIIIMKLWKRCFQKPRQKNDSFIPIGIYKKKKMNKLQRKYQQQKSTFSLFLFHFKILKLMHMTLEMWKSIKLLDFQSKIFTSFIAYNVIILFHRYPFSNYHYTKVVQDSSFYYIHYICFHSNEGCCLFYSCNVFTRKRVTIKMRQKKNNF